MALEVKVKCENETHVIGVTSVDRWGFELKAEIAHPGHDYAYDTGAHEFGYPLPYCYTAVEIIEKGFDDLLADTKLRRDFWQAVSEHGVEALGIERGELADRIVEFIHRMYDTNKDVQMAAFLGEVRIHLPWFSRAVEFLREAGGLTEAMYEHYDMESLGELLKINSNAVTIRMRSDGVDSGDGHVEATATFILDVNDSEIDRWQVHYMGWYWDIDTMEWHVERQDDSEKPDEITVTVLESLGYEDIEEYELSEIRLEEPGYHEPEGKGDWAIFLDDELWGQYKSESHAQETYNAMIDAEEFSGRSSGRYATLKRRADPDDESVDEWEEVE